MYRNFICLLFLLLPLTLFGQEEAVTSSGRVVLLFPDSTWKWKEVVTDTTQHDTLNDAVVVVKAESHKPYADSTTGFKGFLKPELKLPALPEQSEGLYVFRVKVNKEGWVKEITTTQRGPNGQTEAVIRNSITKMKFMPNGSAVPPLTEGIIRITVPPGH